MIQNVLHFAEIATAKYHKSVEYMTSFTALHFWTLEVQGQGMGRLIPPKHSEGGPTLCHSPNS